MAQDRGEERASSVGASGKGGQAGRDRQSGGRGCKSDKIISNPPVFLPLLRRIAVRSLGFLVDISDTTLSNVSNVRGWLLLRLLLNETA